MSNQPVPKQNNQQGGGNGVIKPEMLEKFLDLQTKEQAIRGQELALRTKEMEHNAKQAGDILGAQERDRTASRTHERKMSRDRLIFFAFVLVIAVASVIIALYMGKDQFVIEAMKLIGTFLAGGASGYGVAKVRQDKNQDSSD
ncbi:hypothetical protein WJ24_27700 [Burkholderia vietnamiensis]|uniref:hypothetical protein n=1 Tax=Burkholderia vietnamiensis TaxID=60552 RepID=UPI00075546BE|nr:hypothetical protein [Burkholderia vietnamiensis]KVG05414.1 hypothetical protein WJ24_27700 [Burkholderia vietnamiensis]